MATPIKTLALNLWTHLNNGAEYQALRTVPGDPQPTNVLGLKEFRFVDGVIFPFDWEIGDVNADALPAHFSRVIDGGRERVDDVQGMYRFWIALRNTILVRASEGDTNHSLQMDYVDNAMEAIRLRLDVRANRDALLALNGGGEVEWPPRGGPGIGRNPKGGGAPRFWGWVWEVELRGPAFHV